MPQPAPVEQLDAHAEQPDVTNSSDCKDGLESKAVDVQTEGKLFIFRTLQVVEIVRVPPL